MKAWVHGTGQLAMVIAVIAVGALVAPPAIGAAKDESVRATASLDAGGTVTTMEAARARGGDTLAIGGQIRHADEHQAACDESALSQRVDLRGARVPVRSDSGLLDNLAARQATVYEEVVGEAGAPWLQVFFGAGTRLQPGARIRLTSLDDGAVQDLTAEALVQWGNASAYFNGSQVRIEVIAPAGGRGSRVVIDELFAGLSGPAVPESICGADDRVLSSEPRAGRILSVGCTGWLINECFLSAGHCRISSGVVQFNVPLSTSTGTLNHPPPSDQYSIDPASSQSLNGGVGNDYWYFGVFPNTQTGLTPLAVQQARYTLATEVPLVAGQSIRITGYGVDSTPNEFNQVQQTHAGPYRNFSGTTVEYETDTTGGNSGSPVFDQTGGRAIGIHTHGGCDASPPPYNLGTAINQAGLQAALRSPAGVCANQPGCNGNGICESGEDCFSCVADCGYAPPGGTGPGGCGDNVCDTAAGENCQSCAADCNGVTSGKPSNRYCCGLDVGCSDPRCTGNGNTCPPFSSASAEAASGYCCGDGTCESDETGSSCAIDCGGGCTVNGDCGSGEICCGGACVVAACSSDSQCGDGNTCTTDTCQNPGTCSAVCSNAFPGCGLNDGCCGPSCTQANDPDCACVPTAPKEKGPRCSDGIDNDCDGLIDGADPDC